ncbi:TPA: HAD family hydrolase [Yersinia enterocolitica]
MKKLLITDLDNTLYDWVHFYSTSFGAMLNELVKITGIPKETLLDDFKKVHQKHGNIEYPYAALELPSLHAYFGSENKDFIKDEIDSALHAFNSARLKSLSCYSGVVDALQELKSRGVKIVAHTEAPVRNSIVRIRKLKLDGFFSHLYAPKDKYENELDERTKSWLNSFGDYVFFLDEIDRKPNPKLLLDICKKEGVEPADAVYVGDSIVKDISMANDANITSVWAEYGKQHNPEYWKLLVSITHWTSEGVKKEEELKLALKNVKPDYSISNFSEILELFG